MPESVEKVSMDYPKRCEKDMKNITPTLTLPPPRGKVRVGAQRAPEVKSCDLRKNRYGRLNIKAKNNFRRFFCSY